VPVLVQPLIVIVGNIVGVPGGEQTLEHRESCATFTFDDAIPVHVLDFAEAKTTLQHKVTSMENKKCNRPRERVRLHFPARRINQF
jgi:hypothetical protein